MNFLLNTLSSVLFFFHILTLPFIFYNTNNGFSESCLIRVFSHFLRRFYYKKCFSVYKRISRVKYFVTTKVAQITEIPTFAQSNRRLVIILNRRTEVGTRIYAEYIIQHPYVIEFRTIWYSSLCTSDNLFYSILYRCNTTYKN